MSIVTPARLSRAKYQCVRQGLKSTSDIISAFYRAADMPGKKWGYCECSNFPDYCQWGPCARNEVTRITIDTDEFIQRIRMAKLDPVKDGCYGESDDCEVCISEIMEMTDEELRGTIIHEALHYICKVDRGYGYQWMPTIDEHTAMHIFGKDIQEDPEYFRS
jgi:hypothetical protein